ncbi:MAG: MoaD/ThiS family protein [Planctomycetaceae bacterium]
MQLTLEYAGQIKRAAGVAAESFELPAEAAVLDLLRNAADAHGDDLRRILFDGAGRVHPSLLVFVGDAQIRTGDAPALQPGDVVTVLSPISGG